jgi:hypothetical protein
MCALPRHVTHEICFGFQLVFGIDRKSPLITTKSLTLCCCVLHGDGNRIRKSCLEEFSPFNCVISIHTGCVIRSYNLYGVVKIS